ncbi:hypothetical protein CCACVL1_08219 [Corchorus capsularis]|uniref:Uncharacterized protein n=1 Tax=Corchorus capsularis TaxID=210143 RepID=A0A1R3J1R1_COCAP|nr:hypothetical protein CCACVL1_08219 [Corchorus capsularis]
MVHTNCDWENALNNKYVRMALLALTTVSGIAGIVVAILGDIGNNPKFGLNSLSVTNLNISGSEITGIWDVEFLAKKP